MFQVQQRSHSFLSVVLLAFPLLPGQSWAPNARGHAYGWGGSPAFGVLERPSRGSGGWPWSVGSRGSRWHLAHKPKEPLGGFNPSFLVQNWPFCFFFPGAWGPRNLARSAGLARRDTWWSLFGDWTPEVLFIFSTTKQHWHLFWRLGAAAFFFLKNIPRFCCASQQFAKHPQVYVGFSEPFTTIHGSPNKHKKNRIHQPQWTFPVFYLSFFGIKTGWKQNKMGFMLLSTYFWLETSPWSVEIIS